MIEIKNLSIKLGNFFLKDINLAIGDGEYFVILGPTGAGKTVLIECIAGLHRINNGEIWIDGDNVTGLSPEARSVGYVPQDYVLFPFLNVFENIAFGLKRNKHSKIEIQTKVNALAHLTGISHLLNRDPYSLSGGEKQRVAMARALALSPKILLLDEPLSSLDLQTSKYLRLELRRIQKELGITTVHITHNQMEAEEIADRIAILNRGKLEQVGKPDEIFFYPCNETVSEFIGAPNILDCNTCRNLKQGLMEVHCGGIALVIPYDGDGNSIQKIALSPRDIYISENNPPGPQLNRFKGTITSIKYTAAVIRLGLKVGENNLVAEIPSSMFKNMNLEMGKQVFVIIKFRRIKVYENKDISSVAFPP